MEAVKIKLYQNMVNYKREMSYGYVQTYPLPTPSMVKGMVHDLLKLKKFHNLKISIQGNYESIVTNMQRVYKFSRDRNTCPDNPYDIIVGNSSKTATHGVMFVDLIVEMNLILHICFDEAHLNTKLLEAVKQKTVVLGRNEDIALVDFEQTKMVNLQKCDKQILFNNNIFIPQEIAKEVSLYGTSYRLPFYYNPVSSFEDNRIFKFVDVMYIIKDSEIQKIDYLIDDDNETVFFVTALGNKLPSIYTV
ncbi:MAG: CRISPR-associated protein Cas5 [Desulfobacterales bacterium]|nr:CRISPR-associated protein Cas5 [Desulfobacterales bacterium]